MTRLFAFCFVLLLPVVAWGDDHERSARSFAFTVGNEAARVEPPDGNKAYVSIHCWQPSSTPVYFGGKDVDPRNGYPICSNTLDRQADKRDATATCESDSIRLRVGNLYAMVAPPPRAPESPAQQSISCIIVQ